MKQADAILDYMDKFGSISPMEAFSDLGITKLATRISEMRKAGYEFDQKTEHCITRLGKPTHYCRYSNPRKIVSHVTY